MKNRPRNRRLKAGAMAYIDLCRFTGRFPWPNRVILAAIVFEKSERLRALRDSHTR